MTNRYPLIVNTSTNQIQELSASDNLDLTSSGIINAVSIGATNINVTGVVTASSFVGSFTGTITGTASTASFATTSFGLAGTPNITVGTVTATSLNASGVVTATSFVGNLTGTASTATAAATAYGLTGSPNITVGTVTGNLTGNATGLSGTPNITVNNVVAAAGTFTNLTVNGTQTIINTTSLEISDKNIGIGSTSSPSDANADGSGLTIYGTTNKTLSWSNSTPPYWNLGGGYLQVSGLDLSSLLREGVNIIAGKLSDNLNINLENGMLYLFTTTETTTSTPNIRYSSSISLNSVMNTGEAISVTLITTAAAAAYSAQLTIDGNAVTEYWIGGSAPSTGGSSGYDLHTYTIIKTASATFAVIANRSKTSA